MGWLNLEPIIQSEVNQKERDKILCINTYIQNLAHGTDEPQCRAATGTQTQRTGLWTQWGKEGVGWMERVAWKRLHYRMEN